MTEVECQPMTVATCKLCGKPPGQKVGPPAIARCVNSECSGPTLRALPIPEWNLENAPVYAADEIELLQQKLEFAEFEWNRATDGMKERDATIESLKARVAELEGALRVFRDRIIAHGDWDDGCFYYGATSASELQEPLRLADAALKDQPK